MASRSIQKDRRKRKADWESALHKGQHETRNHRITTIRKDHHFQRTDRRERTNNCFSGSLRSPNGSRGCARPARHQTLRDVQTEEDDLCQSDICGYRGLESGSAKSGISGQLLNQLAQMDGFILVTRGFEDDSVLHTMGSIDPARDADVMLSELLLNDLIAVERKLERLTEERKKGGTDKVDNERQTVLFQRLREALSENTPLRKVEVSAEESRILASFGLLTRKPVLIVFNMGEGQEAPVWEFETPSVALQGKLEMEIAQLSPEDAAVFMQEYGIQELSLNKMIRLSYDLLQVQSFFTVGEDEVRAWETKRGATAQESAGEIHTDLMRGFVRAEVVHYDDLIGLGGMNEAKAKGKLRLEGKEYLVKDGDIVHIRSSL